MPTPAPTPESVADQEKLVKQLEAQSAILNERLAILGPEVDAKRKAVQEQYRARYAETFKEVNVRAALLGQDAPHRVKLYGAVYALQNPTGGRSHAVAAFLENPRDTNVKEGTKPVELGPVSAAEQRLLVWLVALGVGEQVRSLPSDCATRLHLIRQLPEVTATRLASEADALAAYLNVCLELDLGNS